MSDSIKYLRKYSVIHPHRNSDKDKVFVDVRGVHFDAPQEVILGLKGGTRDVEVWYLRGRRSWSGRGSTAYNSPELRLVIKEKDDDSPSDHLRRALVVMEEDCDKDNWREVKARFIKEAKALSDRLEADPGIVVEDILEDNNRKLKLEQDNLAEFFSRVEATVKADKVFQEALEVIRRAIVSMDIVSESHARKVAEEMTGLPEDIISHEPDAALETLSTRTGYSKAGLIEEAKRKARFYH